MSQPFRQDENPYFDRLNYFSQWAHVNSSLLSSLKLVTDSGYLSLLKPDL